MNPKSFLLKILATIFLVQAGIFTYGMVVCTRIGPEKCPNLGDRYEKTFNVMIATTLALLTGASTQDK